jgi:hypothetical protein
MCGSLRVILAQNSTWYIGLSDVLYSVVIIRSFFFLHVDPQYTWVHYYIMTVYVRVSAYGTYTLPFLNEAPPHSTQVAIQLLVELLQRVSVHMIILIIWSGKG